MEKGLSISMAPSRKTKPASIQNRDYSPPAKNWENRTAHLPQRTPCHLRTPLHTHPCHCQPCIIIYGVPDPVYWTVLHAKLNLVALCKPHSHRHPPPSANRRIKPKTTLASVTLVHSPSLTPRASGTSCGGGQERATPQPHPIPTTHLQPTQAAPAHAQTSAA